MLPFVGALERCSIVGHSFQDVRRENLWALGGGSEYGPVKGLEALLSGQSPFNIPELRYK